MYVTIAIIIVVAGLATLFHYFIRPSFSLWVHSVISGAKVQLRDIAKMHMENVKQKEIDRIVLSVIRASKAGVAIDSKDLDNHRQAGGSIEKVVSAMIIAKNANVSLSLELASEIDLAGQDVVDAVQKAVKPFVQSTEETIAVAKDGIELKVTCRVTMRANLENYVGGANAQTILARVTEGINSAVGSTGNHQEIIANPFEISNYIMTLDRDEDSDLDIHQDTAFQVLSIDVADVNLGENVAAKLEAQRAEADASTAKAEAEQREAEAVKHHEEMRTRVLENKAKVTEAEAQIPLAIAHVLRKKKDGSDADEKTGSGDDPGAAPDEEEASGHDADHSHETEEHSHAHEDHADEAPDAHEDHADETPDEHEDHADEVPDEHEH